MVVMAALLAMVDPVPLVVYQRPGATAAQADAELRQCRIITTGPAAAGERPDGAALLDNGTPARAAGDTIEACMATRGWQARTLSERERREVSRLDPAARRKALDRLAGKSFKARAGVVSPGTRGRR